MSDLTACPTCQATLRIPPGAAAIRCPNCKTVLNIPASPTAPAPPPLPFGRSAGASSGKLPAVKLPAAKLPTAKLPAAKPAEPPVPTASAASAAPAAPPTTRKAQTAVRIVSAPEDADPERRKRMQKELRKLEREEERKEEEYEELSELCKHGRTAATLLAWGMRTYAFSLLLLVAGIFAAPFADPGAGMIVTVLVLGAAGVANLLIAAGMGFAIAGPHEGRHIGVMGLVAVLGRAGVTIAQCFSGFARPTKVVDPYSWVDRLKLLDILGPASDLALLAEHPARFLKQYPVSVFGIAGAAAEFTVFVLVCLLAQNYAAAGKAKELGHASMETVGRIFWVVLLSAMFRVSFAFMFDSSQPEELWAKLGQGAHAALTLFSLLLIGLFASKQSQHLADTAEVVDPRRYVLDGEVFE